MAVVFAVGVPMDLVLEFTYYASLAPPLMIGNGPYGTRALFPVQDGRVKGDRISGSFVGGGGDWLLIGSDGWGRLDVRGQIQTDDGVLLYITYYGVLQLTETVMTAVQTMAEETSYEDQYFRITPRIEAGDERYFWVNQTVFVGRGRIIPGGVEYEVYRAT
jgi:hypothetical protein